MGVKCWELEKCGKLECPVYGREAESCWLVSGTHCRDEIQGMFLNKIEICLKCSVFKHNITAEEQAWWKTLDFADKQFKEYVHTIEKQKESINALSTPVLPVWDKILILPLVGIIDDERVQQMISDLLEKIYRTQAKVAIVDITGVGDVDSNVAKHILKTAQSTHLIGCKCIFTGISPHNAKVLSNTQVDFSQILTQTTLQNGLELAFELTKVKIN